MIRYLTIAALEELRVVYVTERNDSMGNNNEYDVIRSVMKLSRAMKRGQPFPPPPPAEGGMGGKPGMFGLHFLLDVLGADESVSSRELAERLDIRPSSLTELLDKAEKAGAVTRTPDEADKRVTRVALTEQGKAAKSESEQRRKERADKVAACFTEDEKAQFCEMCDKLSAHLEQLAEEEGVRRGGMPHGGPCGHHRGGPCGHHHGPHHGPRGFGGHCPPPPPFGMPFEPEDGEGDDE